MPRRMTVLGVGPTLALIVFPYFIFTLILQSAYPSTFSITQTPSIVFPIVGTILIIIGLVIYASGARAIQRAFREGRLLTKGVFSIVRHPMYSGLVIFVFAGIALWLRSWIVLTVPIVGYIAFKLLIREEETYLEERFGKEYLDYKSRVNAIVPFPRSSKK